MKIELIKQTFNEDSRGFKYKPFKWCCDKIKDNPLIELVDECTVDDDYEDYIPCVAIHQTETVRDWEDEWEEDAYYKLTYCPFCGKPIYVSVVGEEDVSEVYNQLKEERDKLWKKYTKTDSKKKSEELRKTVRQLDDKINYFYTLTELNEGGE